MCQFLFLEISKNSDRLSTGIPSIIFLKWICNYFGITVSEGDKELGDEGEIWRDKKTKIALK